MSLQSSKTHLVRNLFVRTADENYITARWCAQNQLNIDFFWLAVHALEKYMKAVLLLNGKSAKKKKDGHNIVELYDQIKIIADSLLPEKLTKHENLDHPRWSDCCTKKFIQYLWKRGNPDNRYLIFGYNMRSDDLYKLDQMVFVVRRLICPLDDRHLPNHVDIASTETHREYLTRKPNFCSKLDMPLDKLIIAKKDSPVRTAALNLNLWFAPPNFQHSPERSGSSCRNPVIEKLILRPLDSADEIQVKETIELSNWLFDNIKVPGDNKKRVGVAKQIGDAMESARKEHGLLD